MNVSSSCLHIRRVEGVDDDDRPALAGDSLVQQRLDSVRGADLVGPVAVQPRARRTGGRLAAVADLLVGRLTVLPARTRCGWAPIAGVKPEPAGGARRGGDGSGGSGHRGRGAGKGGGDDRDGGGHQRRVPVARSGATRAWRSLSREGSATERDDERAGHASGQGRGAPVLPGRFCGSRHATFSTAPVEPHLERNRLNLWRVALPGTTDQEDTRPMDLKLTTRAQEAMAAAVRRAATDGHPQVEPAHLLVGVAGADRRRRSRAARGDHAGRRRGEGRRRPGARRAAERQRQLRQLAEPRPGAYQALSTAGDVARELGDEYISTEHLLIGLAPADATARDGRTGPGAVAGALADAGATRAALLAALPGVRGNGRVTSPDPEGTYKALEKYGNDLTAAGERRQARPRDRPRRRDPPRRAGAVAAAPRTTPCSSASPASARPPSSRGWPSAWSRATSPRACAASAWSRSTSAPWSPARSTAASSRSG